MEPAREVSIPSDLEPEQRILLEKLQDGEFEVYLLAGSFVTKISSRVHLETVTSGLHSAVSRLTKA